MSSVRDTLRRYLLEGYQDIGFTRGGYWGRAGSGILFVTETKPRSILLFKRSGAVEQPGTWGITGGARPVDSDTGKMKGAWQSAKDETKEETGGLPPGTKSYVHVVTFRDKAFRFDTFVVMVPEAAKNWRPRLNWESDDHGWFTEDALPHPLHFGIKYLLSKYDPFNA